MRLLPEVQMRREYVLEEMDQQVAREDVQRCRLANLLYRFGDELDERNAEEVARTQSHEQRQRAIADLPWCRDDRAADEITECRRETEKQDEWSQPRHSGHRPVISTVWPSGLNPRERAVAVMR